MINDYIKKEAMFLHQCVGIYEELGHWKILAEKRYEPFPGEFTIDKQHVNSFLETFIESDYDDNDRRYDYSYISLFSRLDVANRYIYQIKE